MHSSKTVSTPDKPSKVLLFMVSFFAISIATASYAASLTPPGPPAPTTRGLKEIEPRTPISELPAVIGESGSYYLTGNLILNDTNQDGIVIDLGSINTDLPISLDLNGFSIIGPGQGQGRGIVVTGQQIRRHVPITIKNGAVTGWGGNGILAIDIPCDLLKNLHMYRNGGNGLVIGEGSIVREVHAADNGGHGIVAANGSTLDDCIAIGNGQAGFNIAGAISPSDLRESRVQGCIARDNGASGFLLEAGGLVKDCLSYENGQNGFEILRYTDTMQSCSASSNTLSGFVFDGAGNFSVIHCKSSLNGADGYNVSGNTARGVFLSSQAFENVQAGFHLGPNATGIRAFNNSSYGNGQGFFIEGFGNLIVKNSATANANGNFQDIGNGNSVGPAISATDQAPSPWGNLEF